ncbi:DUF3293 domain-containing protein [Tessaracoccus palaemonis]|uniref:DUF3293 domain-containing protein n=1 Tax=Tessaracoccus palaemonis TaxID=2829499 RepID=A0ABX8SDU7_9ACTN|nr:DUF3293 domain-containing protein [Tessaracoccus palaemonis]QXT61613.1 DUF3293 domain-containing protein [Tessaracoccus palaemonis]
MTRLPLRPGQGAFPDDQIPSPYIPARSRARTDGILRRPHGESVTDSYRSNVVRVWPAGSSAPAVDLVPAAASISAAPSDLLGPECREAFIVAGTHAAGRLTTPADDDATVRALRWFLDLNEWMWCPTVATSPDRGWVEAGALIRGVPEDEVADQAAYHGQAVVLRWDERGLVAIPTIAGVDVGDPTPTPVALVPALTGCPLRRGADGVCKTHGGGWTSGSREALLAWRLHRSLLLDAFGCDVCHGEGPEGPDASEHFTPSREGGWQWGPPRVVRGEE